MDKPKEFWIFPQKGNDCEWTNLYPDASWRSETKPLVHVIEYSAYEQLQSKFNEAVEVIKFYSNGGNLSRDIWFDEKLGYFTGKRAREFLRSLDKGE